MLFPISKHTALLTGCYKKEHDDERTFRVIAWKLEKSREAEAAAQEQEEEEERNGENEKETRRLPRRSLLRHKSSIVAVLSFCMINLFQTLGLFPFPHSISSFSRCHLKLDINRQFSSVDSVIIIIVINIKGHINTFE